MIEGIGVVRVVVGVDVGVVVGGEWASEIGKVATDVSLGLQTYNY